MTFDDKTSKKETPSNDLEQNKVVLNNEERDTLLDSLEHPWEPNDALKSLFKK